MTDIVSRETRSRMMSGIRGTNTRPELTVRRLLHAAGFRYRLHVRQLPGRPDIVLPRYHAVIFIHGCFWHGHDCHLFRWPSTRTEFWRQKITTNRRNDRKAINALAGKGWRTLVIWECALKGRQRINEKMLLARCTKFVHGKLIEAEIRGGAAAPDHRSSARTSA